MSHVLISTRMRDVHSAAVALCLRDQGHRVTIFHGNDFPSQLRITAKFSSTLTHGIHAFRSDLSVDLAEVDAVWNRRHRLCHRPKGLDPEDIDAAYAECTDFARGIWLLAQQNAFWVNKESAAQHVFKPVELHMAQSVGLQIPRTIMTNDPLEIMAFIASCKMGTIYKAFRPVMWATSPKHRHLFTSKVQLEDLPSHKVLQSTPGIFHIQKAHEVRVTLMGATSFAARIDSQSDPLRAIDWRNNQLECLNLSPTMLPQSIYEACRRLMKRLDIVFGCFDFVVTPEGEYIFLEVNEAGQFLFIEDELPEFRMLDAFARFLVTADPDFLYKESPIPATLKAYVGSKRLHDLIASEVKKHVPLD